MLTKKRGIQLNEAFGAVLAVVLLAILVIVAIVLFEALGTSFTTTTTTVTNESGAFINATGYTVTNSTACNFNTFSVTQAFNVTSGLAIGLGNITANSDTGVITNATNTNFDDVNVSYTYLSGAGACEATDDMITQFGTYPALVGLVGTIVFLGLVIGVLVGSFVFGGNGSKV